METAALMNTSQLAKKPNCLPEWIQENEEPYRYRAWGTGFLSFRREQRRGRGREGPPLSAAHPAAHLASAHGAHAVAGLACLQPEGAAAPQLLVPQLDGASLL